LNKCSRVQPVQIALSDRSDTSFALQSDPGFGDAYRYLRPSEEAGNGAGEIVPVITLDLYASRNGIEGVDFIKVDVEGFEYMVFTGARELLASSPNVVVMFESDPEWCARSGCRQQDSFELLRKLKFRLYSWNGRNRKWTADEPSIVGATTVWASRNPQRLPVM
jgi:FkbM family methyltransferase